MVKFSFYKLNSRLAVSSFYVGSCRKYSSAKNSHVVVIPKRKERGPTDLLKALSETVNRDPTAFPYEIPDDPYFSVFSIPQKRTLALSLESGKKSAQWIVEENPHLFRDKISEPFIKAFAPKADQSVTALKEQGIEVTEKLLVATIKQRKVSGAIELYEELHQKITLSRETKQILLELLCFYNCKDNEWDNNKLQEKWFERKKSPLVKTWKNKGIAEELFESMKSDDCPLAYSTIIQGMLKYGEIDKAIEIFEEAKKKNLTLSVGVYNKILTKVSNIKDRRRWNLIIELLKEMEEKKVTPDLYTLNAIMEYLLLDKEEKNSNVYALKVLTEFQKFNVNPSLGTYYFLLNIKKKNKNMYPDAKSYAKHFKIILKKIENKKLEIEHPSDLLFFPSAIEIISKNLNQSFLGHLLYKILMKGGNIKFLNGSLEENTFYNNYLWLIFKTEPIDYAINLYKSIVPTVYIPTSLLHSKMIQIINENEAFHFLPILWNNIYKGTVNFMISPAHDILNGIIFNKEYNEETLKVFLEATNLLFDALEGRVLTDEQVRLDGSLVSNALVVYAKVRDYNKIKMVLQLMNEKLNWITLNDTALTALYEFYLSEKMCPQIVDCLKLCEEIKHPKLSEMAANALKNLSDFEKPDQMWLENLAKPPDKDDKEIDSCS